MLTTEQAATALGITPGAVRKAVQQGRLAPVGRMGKRLLVFDPVEVERYRDAEKNAGGRPKGDQVKVQKFRAMGHVTAEVVAEGSKIILAPYGDRVVIRFQTEDDRLVALVGPFPDEDTAIDRLADYALRPREGGVSHDWAIVNWR